MNRQVSKLSDTDDPSQTSLSLDALPQPQRHPEKSKNRNKLNFKSLGVYGRDKESSLLNACFDQLLTGNVDRQLVLISGTSGSGKSKLAKTLKRPTEECNGLFVVGKFESGCRSEPYSGIARACEEICNAILNLNEKSPVDASLVSNHIKREVGSELPLLMQIIPVLEKVFRVTLGQEEHVKGLQYQRENTAALIQGSALSSSMNSNNRFQFAFLRFMRVMTTEFDPLVIVIDDLQWADAPSLELMEGIVSDRNNPKLLIIGTYRSNEVDQTHIFSRSLQEWRARSKEKDFVLTEIQVNNLGLEDTHRIIQTLLACESSERTLTLAQVCFEKTLGNAFFLLHFLSMLRDQNLLRFGVNGYSWTWDEEEIKESTNATDNVLDLLKTKMLTLTPKSREILTLAAYLGATFELRNLTLVWKSISEDVQEGRYEDSLVADLKELEKDGFLVNISKATSRYSWAHDKIQEAALSMVPQSEQILMGRRIGEILIFYIDEIEEMDFPLFVAVNLINAGSNPTDLGNEARLKLASMNVMAGQKAISMSAFESASVYAAAGIRFLPDNAWKVHYNVALQLYSIGAKADGFLGNVETMERYCKEVMSQEGKPIEDMFDVYNSWIDSISNRMMNEAAIDIILEILERFKCRFPTSMIGVGFAILVNVLNIKVTMKSRDASTLEKMNDETRVALMKLLDKLATCMYMVCDSRMPLTIFRSLSWSMKYGYCDYSPVAFATTGMMLTGVLDDVLGGARYGQQALALLEKSKSITTASRTMFIVYSFLYCWTKPWKNLLQPLLHAYDVGLKSGDTESAIWAVHNWFCLNYIMGSSLDMLEPAAKMYSKQMIDLKRDQTLYAAKCMRQMFLNMMGQNNLDDPTSMIGDALTQEDFDHCQNGTVVLQVTLNLHQSFLWMAFGNHMCNANMTIKCGHDYVPKAMIGSSTNMRDALTKGVSCFAAARETGKREYAQIAKELKAKIQKWLDVGNPNIQHYKSFLDAEAMALKGQPSNKVVKQYDLAILQAARGGYKHDAAFACERLGEYYLSLLPVADQNQAQKWFTKSSKYWRSWGAMGKVYDLEKRYSHLTSVPDEVNVQK